MSATRSKAKSNSNGNGVVKPFKYRSIDEIAKKQILEQNRRELEAQHYGVRFRVDVLKSLPEVDDESVMSQRNHDIEQMENSLVIWEGMIERYNDELLTLNEEIAANNDDNKE